MLTKLKTQQLLSATGQLDVEVLTAHTGWMPVDENADSFKGNAGLKAKALHAAAAKQSMWVLADDSGLMVTRSMGLLGSTLRGMLGRMRRSAECREIARCA